MNTTDRFVRFAAEGEVMAYAKRKVSIIPVGRGLL
jgi:hypothetical protein